MAQEVMQDAETVSNGLMDSNSDSRFETRPKNVSNGEHEIRSEENSKSASSPFPMDVDVDDSLSSTGDNHVKSSNDGDNDERQLPPNPFGTLIRAAQLMNPEQFSIPPEFVSSVAIPGVTKRVPHTTSRNRKLPHELDNGLVPIPVKTCYFCNRSCKKAPLIQVYLETTRIHMTCIN